MTWNFVQILSVAKLLHSIIDIVSLPCSRLQDFFFSHFCFTISFELFTQYEIKADAVIFGVLFQLISK